MVGYLGDSLQVKRPNQQHQSTEGKVGQPMAAIVRKRLKTHQALPTVLEVNL